MAIVIRLQNLPWAGNSLDIRRYFSGLSIPEGGVHIVGGENGDAFIAFSTDEDARQAMQRDGGKIKDMKVKLLLSSRTEMTRVIETARNQNIALQPATVVKAAATDSDRRKVRDRSPSPRRRDREKSPLGRDRDRDKRRTSVKRDRSRSRSPFRRGRDRDSDRRNDRGRRDDRRSDDSQKSKDDRDRPPPNSREQPEQDRKLFRGGPPNTAQGADGQNKTFDARLASSAPNFATGQMEPGRMGLLAPEQRPAVVSNAPIYDNTKFGGYTLESASAVTRGNEASRLPAYTTGAGFPATFTSNSSHGNYQAKRPSPTPGTSAPNLDSSTAYAKSAYTQSSQAGAFNNDSGNHAKTSLPSYTSAHLTGRGNAAAPAEKRILSNQPIYGAEPHARYDHVPEPNQADRSASASRPRESLGNDMSSFGQKNMPSSAAKGTKARRSRFEPEQTANEGDQYSVAKLPENKGRPFPGPSHRPNQTESLAHRPRNNTNTWPEQSSGPAKGMWNEGHAGGLLAPPGASGHNEDFNQVVPMELEDEEELPHSHNMPNAHHPHESKMPFRRGPPILNNGEAPLIGDRNDMHPNRNIPRGPLPLTVEIRGLPFDAGEQDVVEFFRGLLIPPTNLKLQRNRHGDSNGCAFVKFVKPLDCQEALSRHNRSIRNHCISVQVCPPVVYDNAPVSAPPLRNANMARPTGPRMNLPPCAEDLCIEIRSLPLSCTEDDIVNFFDGLGILDICMELGPDGRVTGVAFLEFGTPADFHSALDMNGKSIGRRQVIVSTTSKETMSAAQAIAHGLPLKKPSYPPRGPPREGVNSPNILKDQRAPIPDGPSFCVTLRGLPKMVQNSDIADFFAEINVIPRAIHIMLDANKLPAGEAFAEFVDGRQLDLALKRSGKYMSGCRVSVVPIPHAEMMNILGDPHGPMPPRNPRDEERMSRRPFMQKPMDGSMPSRSGPPRNRSQFDHPERPPFGNMRGPMRPPGFGTDGPRGAPRFSPRHPGPTRYVCPPADNEPLNFGTPGTVVGIHNLHFRAGLDEILEFFCDFDIDKDSVIRKYSETGQTLGEARVSFKCHEDAVRAVKMLNKKPIFGRPLTLSLV